MSNYRNKIIVLDERFNTGEPTVQPVVLWGLRGKPLYERLSKEASHSPAMDYIKHVTPVPGRTIVLIIGLGAFEHWGLNRNGDGFPEQPYNVGIKPKCGCCGKNRDAWILPEECVQHHYQTYEKGNAFRHHCNKDPKKRIGRILKAFFNPFMHRIEVLKDINNEKAPDIVERIADGELVACSMGCRIKFDVCTACGHMAPTRKHYCDHLKWTMGQLDPETGIRYGALNPSPNFFDSSFVVRPADRTGYMLRKVATSYEVQSYDSSALGDLVDELNQKAAAASKLAVIDKVVRGYPAAMVTNSLPEAGLIEKYRQTALPNIVENTSQLSSGEIKNLAPYNLAETLAALSHAGIILTTPEFVRLFIEKASPGTQIPPDVLENLTALQSEFFDVFKEHPSLLKTLENTLTTEPKPTQEKLSEAIRPLLEKRSTLQEYVTRRMTPKYYQHGEEPMTDLLEVTDPASGRTYQTTRGAARAAHDEIQRKKLLRLVGSGAILGGAYKVLTSLPGRAKMWALPLAAGGYTVGSGAFEPTPAYATTTGENVPYLTEFHEKRSSLLDTLNALGMDYGITKTGSTVLTRTYRRENPALHYFMQKLASFGLCYPQLTLESLVTSDIKLASNGITEENLDFDKTAEIIGALVWGRIY